MLIVDEHTGRMLAGRRYNDGLHQAIEAKEGVEVREEYQTLATVTLQNYFRLYEKLSGMTGTAMTEASEFDKIYNLGVVPIPTNKPMARIDQADLVYRTEEAKYDAVVEDIAERHEKGQPVLVGTVSVEKSEHLSNKLRKRGIPHTVLNAKVHADEAKIVAMAGHKGAVTVATNMAGRGTDIMLGGSVEFLADEELRKQGLEPAGETAERVRRRVARRRSSGSRRRSPRSTTRSASSAASTSSAPSGTSRAASTTSCVVVPAVRATRASPGSTCRSQDELMRLFKSDWVDRVLQVLKIPDDVPIENKRVTSAIANAQGQVESQNFESRKNVLKYDDVMDRQRKVIYAERREVLEGKDLEEQIRTFLDDTVDRLRQRGDRGVRRGVGPRRAVDRAAPDLPGQRRPRRRSSRRPAASRASTATSSSRRSRPTPTRRTTGARRRSARRSCASSSVASCCRCSTASGASTSTRWTTCARASTCGPTRSATRWSSTSARASRCSPR